MRPRPHGLSRLLLTLFLISTVPSLGACERDAKAERKSEKKPKRKKKKKKKNRSKSRKETDGKTKEAKLEPLEASAANIAKAIARVTANKPPPDMNGRPMREVHEAGLKMCRRMGDAAVPKLLADVSKRHGVYLRTPPKKRFGVGVELDAVYDCMLVTGPKGCSEGKRLYKGLDQVVVEDAKKKDMMEIIDVMRINAGISGMKRRLENRCK